MQLDEELAAFDVIGASGGAGHRKNADRVGPVGPAPPHCVYLARGLPEDELVVGRTAVAVGAARREDHLAAINASRRRTLPRTVLAHSGSNRPRKFLMPCPSSQFRAAPVPSSLNSARVLDVQNPSIRTGTPEGKSTGGRREADGGNGSNEGNEGNEDERRIHQYRRDSGTGRCRPSAAFRWIERGAHKGEKQHGRVVPSLTIPRAKRGASGSLRSSSRVSCFVLITCLRSLQ